MCKSPTATRIVVRLIALPLCIRCDNRHCSITELCFQIAVIFINVYPTNPRDRIRFWNAITEPKADLTDLGHFSGSGLVDFSGRQPI